MNTLRIISGVEKPLMREWFSYLNIFQRKIKMAYNAKNPLQDGRQLEVQSLVIPLYLVGNSTAASVTLNTDEPGFVFLNSSSVNQITAALQTNETATFSAAPADASGTVQCLIQIQESLVKVCDAQLRNRVGSSSGYTAYLGNTVAGPLGTLGSGVTTGTGGGQSIMLVLTTGVNLTSTAGVVDACLEVNYIVHE